MRLPVRPNVDRYALAAALAAGAVLTATSPIEASLAAYLGGAAGLVAIHERLRAEFPRSVALLTALAIFAGTSLFWSMTRSPRFADVAAFGLVAALGYLADRLLLGRSVVWCLIAISPFTFRYLAGQISLGPSTSVASDASNNLFSSTHGFLSLSPVAYVALLGLLVSLRRHPVRGAGTLLILGIWLLGNSLVRTAAGPVEGPAAHHLTPALALLAPGLAYLVDWARRHPVAAVAPLIVAGLAWNYWLMVQYTVGAVPKDAPVNFAEMVRQQAEVHTGRPYAYPFAFPANVWFAWRERVPVDRYELLASEPRRSVMDLALDRHSDRFVLEGWEARSSEDREVVRWIVERSASLVVPLAVSAGRALVLSATLRARLEDPPVTADLALEVNGHEVGRFSATSDVATTVQVTVPADTVGRIFRAGYNRLTFVSHGVHRSDSPDQRAAEPLESRSGRRAWPVAVYRIRIAPQ